MEITNEIKKRFCKDFKIPITVFQSPYYEYFIDLYDSHYKIEEKTKWLEKTLTTCETQSDFFDISEKIAKGIKSTISSTVAFEKFTALDLNKEFKSQERVSSQNIYIPQNVGKNLISIDLEKANFNSLNMFGLKEELKINSYKELIEQFTSQEYFINSKVIRQVIFGDLNPAKQQKIQKYIINSLCSELLKEGCTLSSASSDEIIISNDISVDTVKNILKNVPQEFKFFRVEKFSFDRIVEDHTFYMKTTVQENNEEKKEFKNVPGHLHSQVFKKYYGMEINDKDLTFYHEHMLAQFKEPFFKKEISFKNKKKI